MNDQTNPTNTDGQSGIDQETQRRNQENETGQQADQQFGQQTGQQSQTPSESTANEPESGFVGSTGDQSSDYLTEGENQDFQPEGQGASDSNSADADMTTGQPTSSDSTLDDGADTGR